MFKKTLVLLFSMSFLCPVFSQNSAALANRRTAVRYLQLSKQFASEKLWNDADSNARMGLAYDDKIADLWYLRSVAQMHLGEKKSKILLLVEKALNDSEWVDYNRDAARILYADILCTSRRFTESIKVLDEEPFIYSADAEYIRAKNYYCMADAQSIKNARAKLDSARKVYPSDSRFASLFYTYEYSFYRKNASLSPEVKAMAEAFSLMLPLYKNAGKELEIYAAVFASSEKNGKTDSKKVRLLKAFNSKKLTSPLYAIEALKTGLLDEQTALDYFYRFSDDTVSNTLLEDFAALLKSKEAKKEFTEYLNSYGGTLTFDTDGDLTCNMKVRYKRGRPEYIAYDENQDDSWEWQSNCDFGLPLNLIVADNDLELEYSSWPYINAAVYKLSKGSDDSQVLPLRLSLIAETLSWCPFNILSDAAIKKTLDFDFFIPLLEKTSHKVSGEDLIRAALSYSIPSKERRGAVIQVSLLNGLPQLASYKVGDKVYALAKFEKGIPVSRKLDVDGDGLFETCEYYAFSTNENDALLAVSDEMQAMTNLFGSPVKGTGLYVKKITIDRNGDTHPDFTEEYIAAESGDKKSGKISSWDTDDDGEWNVQYIKYPSSDKEKLLEEAKFHQPLTDSIVTVTSENGIPAFVKNGKDVLAVKKGNAENYYWIAIPGSDEDESKIIKAVNEVKEQGVSMIVDSFNKRFLAVRIEKMIFGMEIPDEKLPELVNKTEAEGQVK